jgi:hypothetical protein
MCILCSPTEIYVEKGDENDPATVFPAPSPQHFFWLRQAGNNISYIFARLEAMIFKTWGLSM